MSCGSEGSDKMATVREGIGLVCSSVLVGVLYGFPVIGAVVAQLLGTGELIAAVEEPRFETRMIDTPMYAPEGDKGEDPIADENAEPAKPAKKQVAEQAPPPATRAMADAAEPVDSELVDVAELGDAEETSASKRGKKCLPDNDGIVQLDDATWRIDSGILDYYVKHINQAQKLAWVGWDRGADGKVDGFKVKRMRCGSVLRQAGLENGDVIQAINGKSVHSIPTAISAYTKLRSKNVLRLTVSRDGQILHIKYKLT
jgi:hypothetical protein